MSIIRTRISGRATRNVSGEPVGREPAGREPVGA